MGSKTGIQWTESTWNFLRGCSMVSPGCTNCYAMYVAARFNGPGEPFEGLAYKRSNGMAQWSGEVRFIPEHLSDPLRWQKPRRIFTNSVSDLFHETVPFEIVAAAFAVMAATPRHQHQVLTKRPERMLEFFTWLYSQTTTLPARSYNYPWPWEAAMCSEYAAPYLNNWMPKMTVPQKAQKLRELASGQTWPLPNVWMGVSVESQPYAHRAYTLTKVPAAVRFVSAEPLLGSVNLMQIVLEDEKDKYGARIVDAMAGPNGIDWVIAGAESGSPERARPMNLDWVRALRDQRKLRGSKFFFKQDAKNGKKIGTPYLDGEQWMEMPDEDSKPILEAQGSLGL